MAGRQACVVLVVAMADVSRSRCQLCRQRGTRDNPVNRHHVRGRCKGRDERGYIMLTHSRTCHLFAQWITNLYMSAGRVDELRPEMIVYLFNRIATLREKEVFELPVFP
jgi:hypothetical protein